MEPILVCMKFCNKYLIMIINHTNRMTFGTRVARKSKSQLFQRFGPEDELQWAMAEDHTSSTTCEGSDWNDSAQEDRGRRRILFSIATFNSLRYEAILFSAEIVGYFLYFLWSLFCLLKVFLAPTATQLLGSTYCSPWQSADYVLYPPQSLLGFFVFYL